MDKDNQKRLSSTHKKKLSILNSNYERYTECHLNHLKELV